MHLFQDLPLKRIGMLCRMNPLSWIVLCMGILLIPLSLYYFSPYWASHKLINTLKAQDIYLLKKKIPPQLLAHILPNTHPEKKWQGAGSQYLKHVWPKLYQEIDPEVWLSLQVQGLNDHEIRHYYQHYFNQYVLDLGSDNNNKNDNNHDQIRIEMERTSFIHWRVKRVCYPNPQPDWVVNLCPSSKR